MPLVNLVAYNATLPISRLLIPELFSEIIHIALDNDLPKYLISRAFKTSGGDIHDARPPEWRLGAAIAASHVCFAWRRLCIATPTLWARQIGYFTKATSTLLGRSGYALLDVVYAQDPDCWRSIPSIGSSRVRRLHWRIDSENRIDHPSSALTLCMLLNGNLSNLEDLSVQIESSSYRESMGRLLASESLGSTPRLTLLDFTGTFMPFIAPRLTNLNLHTLTLSLSQLLEALRAAPLLEVFQFMYCEVQVDRAVDATSLCPSHPNPVILRRLAHVHIDDISQDVQTHEGLHGLFDCLQIAPPSLSVTLEAGITFPLFAISLRTGLNYRPLPFLRMETFWEMWAIKPHALHLPPSYSSVSSLQIGNLDSYITDDENFGPMVQSLNLQELLYVTELELVTHVDEYFGRNGDTHPLLCALPNVHTFWIKEGKDDAENPAECCINLLNDLASEGDESADEPNPDIARIRCPFPRLQVLGITGANLNSEDILEQLVATLTRRNEIGYPILQMLSLPTFCQDDGMSDVATCLEQLAGTIFWGGEPDDRGTRRRESEESDEDAGALEEGHSDDSDN